MKQEVSAAAVAAEQDDVDCAICLCKFTDAMQINRCKHTFCQTCLSRWLESLSAAALPSCPLCREPLEGDHVATGIKITARTPLSKYFRVMDDKGTICLATNSILTREQMLEEDTRTAQRIRQRFMQQILSSQQL